MSKGRYYTASFKTEAVALVASGHSVAGVARQFGIPDGTLGRWVTMDRRSRRTGGSDADRAEAPVDAATHRAALRRIADLERENEFLGKASAYFAQKVHP